MPIVTGPGFPAFSPLEVTAVFEILAGASLVFPAGRLLVAIYSASGVLGTLLLESLSNDGWEPVTSTGNITDWVAAANKTNMFPGGIVTDGVSWRIRVPGGAPCPGIQYYYMPV